MRFATVLFLILLLLPSVAFADQIEDGQAAFDRHDYKTALKLWRPLAEQGDPKAQVNIGVMYDHALGVKQDFAEAMKWYRKAADRGNAAAQVNLGMMYQKGWGVKQDYVQAYMWLSLATGGNVNGEKELDQIAAKMTPEQVAEAKRLIIDRKLTSLPQQP